MMRIEHALRYVDSNGRGMSRAACWCGETVFGSSPDDVHEKIRVHAERENHGHTWVEPDFDHTFVRYCSTCHESGSTNHESGYERSR